MSDDAPATPKAAVIQVAGLTKSYGSRLAVDDLSFEVGPGEVLGLVGPNGAGKTTAMRSITGLITPSQGTITVAGFDRGRDEIEVKRRLTLIPDEPSLFSTLTIWEHLEFTAKVYGVESWREKGERLLRDFELFDRRRDLADELSRGMRQKVAIACGLLHDPAAVFLDEPLTGLDPRAIRVLYDTLRQRAAAGAAIVLSSHLLSQIEKLCTKFLILREGRRVAYGTLEQIRAQIPSLQADASLEEVFFSATEGPKDAAGTAAAATPPAPGPAA